MGNNGCFGGLEVYAFNYAEANPIEYESDYGYVAKITKCQAEKSLGHVSVANYTRVQKDKVAPLKAAVA